MTTFEKVQDIIADKLKCDKETVKPETTFKDLNPDSLDAADMFFEIEDVFNIDIDEDASKNLQSVNDIVELVDAYVKNPSKKKKK